MRSAISSPSRRPKLGALVNRVNHSDKIRPWTFGAGALMRNLASAASEHASGAAQERSSPCPTAPQFHRRRMVTGARPPRRHQSVERRRRDRRLRAGGCGAGRLRSPRQSGAPAWAAGSIQERSNLLDRVGTEILARKDELGRLLSREEGKTLPEGVGEAARAGHIFKFFAGEVLRLTGDKVPSVRPGIDVEVTREPVGVVGLITPWNFPIAIPAWKIAPALAYGNTVVFKPAELVPGCAWAVAEILVQAGIPAGVFNLVMGRGSVVGDVLVNDPDVAALSFTGSVGTGRGIAAKGIARMAKLQLEMGGKNPLVVLDDADLATRGERRDAGRLLLDGPALHGIVAAHRHVRAFTTLRRGDNRQAEVAQRSTTRWRQERTSGLWSIRASSSRIIVTRDRKSEGARLEWAASVEARYRGLLPCRRRSSRTRANSMRIALRRDLRTRWLA
jgi:hypothetical protein